MTSWSWTEVSFPHKQMCYKCRPYCTEEQKKKNKSNITYRKQEISRSYIVWFSSIKTSFDFARSWWLENRVLHYAAGETKALSIQEENARTIFLDGLWRRISCRLCILRFCEEVSYPLSRLWFKPIAHSAEPLRNISFFFSECLIKFTFDPFQCKFPCGK